MGGDANPTRNSAVESASQSEPDPALVDALRNARDPWTVDAVRECARDPDATKATAAVCDACDRPCEAGEVCATVVARGAGLLDEVGRSQAFHLVESGMQRLRVAGTADVRDADRPRPNTFIEIETE